MLKINANKISLEQVVSIKTPSIIHTHYALYNIFHTKHINTYTYCTEYIFLSGIFISTYIYINIYKHVYIYIRQVTLTPQKLILMVNFSHAA